MPLGFRLTELERNVLNALGKSEALTASQVGRLAQVEDAIGWMERFLSKLAEYGLDLIMPGQDRDGEPTYILRR